MAEIKDWDVAAANNNDPSPDGAPEGMAPSGVNDVIRENMAVLARWLGDTNGALTATGTADAQLLAPNRTVTAYARGDVYAFRPVADNTGACTLNVSSLGAKSIKTPIGTDPLAGALDTSSVATVIYDGTNFVLVSGAGSASFTNVDIGGGNIDGTAVGGSTPAAGAFTTLTASGDVTVDTDTFFVDVSTDRVGIGTASPGVTLDVSSGVVNNDIARLYGTSASRGLVISSFAVGGINEVGFDFDAPGAGGSDGTITLSTSGSERVRVTDTGNVGIGTTSPAEKLDVVGNAKVSGETYSITGTTSVPSATWTTIRSFSATDIEQGMVTVFFGGTTSGLVGAYNKLYDGGASNGNASFINRLDAADVRISGNNLQVYHNTGTTVTASWYCLITRAG